MIQNIKLLALFTIFSLFGFSAMAQDIIILKNGDEIKSIVREVEDEYVLYKKWEDRSESIYYLRKDEVLIIMYQNGTKDIFNEVVKPSEPKPAQPSQTPTIISYQQSDVQLKMKEVYWKGKLKYSATRKKVDNPESLFYGMSEVTKNYRLGTTLYGIGMGVWSAGVATMCYCMIDAFALYRYGIIWRNPVFWSGFGVAAAGGILAGIGSSKIKTAVEIYNASLRRQSTATLSLNLGITQSGEIGFILNY